MSNVKTLSHDDLIKRAAALADQLDSIEFNPEIHDLWDTVEMRDEVWDDIEAVQHEAALRTYTISRSDHNPNVLGWVNVTLAKRGLK